jgi:predicted nucleic acid-binding protein
LYDPNESGVAALENNLIPVTRIVLSQLARVEFVSAFQRKVQLGDLQPQQAAAVVAAFSQVQAEYDWVALSEPILAHAAHLLVVHSSLRLRSLDAIQLACALAPDSSTSIFFSHDQRLVSAAQASGLRTG